jgi:hypothetical protein
MKTRSNAFVALISMDGQWDMSTSKLQQNTRSITFVAVLLKYDAPLLQLAINTLPSLTLANAVGGTRFGLGCGNYAFSHAAVRRLRGQSKISY